MTTDGGKTWSPIKLDLASREWVDAVAFSADGQTGLVRGDKGSVFMTTDGGKTWEPPSFALARGERVSAVGLSADGQTGLVGGDEGSVFMATDGGKTWSPIRNLSTTLRHWR